MRDRSIVRAVIQPWLLIGIGVALIAAILITPWGRALLLANYANLLYLHDPTDSRSAGSAVEASALWPSNERLRLSAAEAAASAGLTDGIIDLLHPLSADAHSTRSQQLILFALLMRHRHGDAIRAFENRASLDSLPSGMALSLINAYDVTGNVPRPEDAELLVTQAFGLDATDPAYESLGRHVRDMGFWSSALARRIRASARSCQATDEKRSTSSDSPTLEEANPIDIVWLANQLGVAPTAFRVGSDLVELSTIRAPRAPLHVCQPNAWYPVYFTRGMPWGLGIFVLSTDETFKHHSWPTLRIDSIQIKNQAGGEGARAGFWFTQPITVENHAAYAVTLTYRTVDVAFPAAAVWLSGSANTLTGGDFVLPPTDGQWKRVTIISWNRSGKDTTVRPLLRLWGEGTVWFNDFSLRPIVSSSTLQPHDPVIKIENAPHR